jgi:hypothetical protein
MEINISVRKGHLVVFVLVLIGVLGVGYVIAFNPGGVADPSKFGHSLNEVLTGVTYYQAEFLTNNGVKNIGAHKFCALVYTTSGGSDFVSCDVRADNVGGEGNSFIPTTWTLTSSTNNPSANYVCRAYCLD